MNPADLAWKMMNVGETASSTRTLLHELNKLFNDVYSSENPVSADKEFTDQLVKGMQDFRGLLRKLDNKLWQEQAKIMSQFESKDLADAGIHVVKSTVPLSATKLESPYESAPLD